MDRRASWDEYFMNIARVVSSRSNCIKRKVGAVIALDRRIISTGYMSARARDASEVASARGVEASVLHVSTIKPFDGASVLALARETGTLVMVLGTSGCHMIMDHLEHRIPGVAGVVSTVPSTAPDWSTARDCTPGVPRR